MNILLNERVVDPPYRVRPCVSFVLSRKSSEVQFAKGYPSHIDASAGLDNTADSKQIAGW